MSSWYLGNFATDQTLTFPVVPAGPVRIETLHGMDSCEYMRICILVVSVGSRILVLSVSLQFPLTLTFLLVFLYTFLHLSWFRFVFVRIVVLAIDLFRIFSIFRFVFVFVVCCLDVCIFVYLVCSRVLRHRVCSMVDSVGLSLLML